MEQENKRTGTRLYTYRNLDVWKRSQDAAINVIRTVAALPASRVNDSIVRQIVRSSSSVGANIAEGHGRFTLGAFRNHLHIARGSACETDNWLDLLVRLELITPGTETSLHSEYDTVIGALTNRIRALNKQIGDPPTMVRESSPLYGTESRYDDDDS